MLLGSEDLLANTVKGNRTVIEQTLELDRQRNQRLTDMVAAALRKVVRRG